jgi:hypothetical protein
VCAGEPHARFGGRGGPKPFPTPIETFRSTYANLGAKSMIQATGIIAAGALLLWSMTVAAQELMHFPSFEDNGPGRSSTVLNRYLSRPTGEGQHPAVIFLHGCGGLLMGSTIEPGESD